jgi:hypothetical protein
LARRDRPETFVLLAFVQTLVAAIAFTAFTMWQVFLASRGGPTWRLHVGWAILATPGAIGLGYGAKFIFSSRKKFVAARLSAAEQGVRDTNGTGRSRGAGWLNRLGPYRNQGLSCVVLVTVLFAAPPIYRILAEGRGIAESVSFHRVLGHVAFCGCILLLTWLLGRGRTENRD